MVVTAMSRKKKFSATTAVISGNGYSCKLVLAPPVTITDFSTVNICSVLLSFSGNNGFEEEECDELEDPTYEDVGPPIPVKKAIDRRRFSQEETKFFIAL